MHKRLILLGLVVIFALGAIAESASAQTRKGTPQRKYADTVLINGKIITVNSRDSIAQGVAIKDGKIMAVGTRARIKTLTGTKTQVIDLRGCTVTPGLIDSHVHFSGTSDLYKLKLGYPEVKSIADIVAKVQAQVALLTPGEWVQGAGWDEGKYPEARYVYAADLDPVSPNNPVYLVNTTGHYAVANSVALAMAGITAATPDPPFGIIDRYPDGTPTGVLKETAKSLVTSLIPPFSVEQEINGVEYICQGFNSEGMTGAKDGGGDQSRWDNYKAAEEQGRLTVRTFFMWRSPVNSLEASEALAKRIAPFTKPYASIPDPLLISGGVKMFMDGSGGSRTAWMNEVWNKNMFEIDTGNFGYPASDETILREAVKLYVKYGLHVSTHCVGDRASDYLIESYKQALQANPVRGLRLGIIHNNIPTDWALKTLQSMQKEYESGYPEQQPVFCWYLGDVYAPNFGPIRNLRLNPLNTYEKMGILWGGGSDYTVDPYAARYGLWASVARRTLLGTWGWYPFGTAESINIHQALRAFTMGSAHQMFMDEKVGSIETGKLADIAVWDKDLYTIPTDEIKDIKCQLTLLGGKIVYQADGTPVQLH